MKRNFSIKKASANLLGSAILAFGLYHIHAFAAITEGGVLGMTLLLQHWFSVSPAVSGLVLNAACYLFGWRVLGRDFILYSLFAGGGFSLFYAVFEQFPPLWPQLAQQPFAAAVLGAVFVGVGVGICVRADGAPSGDDALAMGLARLTRLELQWVYLVSDLLVLGLSVSYLPPVRLGWSLLTVVLSGQIIGLVQKLPLPRGRSAK
ncbi:MAG: YitT family protein [Oscillospiraceae bacterium]|nr:YitT family protein [Oscillospiraceae bacterium]